MKISFYEYNSFLVSIYIYYQLLNNISRILLIPPIFPIIIMIILSSLMIFEIKNINLKSLFLLFVFLCIFILNIILTKENLEVIGFHFMKFLAYGILASLVGSLKIKSNSLEKWLTILSYINIFIMMYIGFRRQEIYLEIGYMTFGTNLLISPLILFYLDLKNKKRISINKIMIILSLVILLIYGNRFSILLSFLGIIILDWSYRKNNYKKWLIYSFFSFGLGIIYLNLKEILLWIYNIFSNLEYKMYGLLRLINSLERAEVGKDISSGRMELYKDAVEVIFNNPFGIGIFGYLKEIKYAFLGYYPHNIFLEIGMHWGILGLVIFIIFLFKLLKKIANTQEKSYKIFLILLALFNLRLLLSDTYISYSFFWLLIAISFNKSYQIL